MKIKDGKLICETEIEKQKYNFLKNHFKFTEQELIKIHKTGAVLNMRSETVVERVRDLQEYLHVSEDVVKEIIIKSATALLPIETVKERISFFAKTFNVSEEKVKEIYIKFPSVLTYKKESSLFKVKKLKELIGFTDEEISTLIASNPRLLGSNMKTIESNCGILKNEFGYNAGTIKNIFLVYLELFTSKEVLSGREHDKIANQLGIPRDTLNQAYLRSYRAIDLTANEFSDRIDSIQELLHIKDRNIIIKKIKNFIQLFIIPDSVILKKTGYYKAKFSLSEEVLGKVFSADPSLMRIKEPVFEDKVKFYTEELGMSKDQLRTAFISAPTLFDLVPKTVAKKIEAITSAGFTIDDIVDNIQMLTAGPAETFKLRYAICANHSITPKWFLYKKLYMFNENKLYARAKYIESCTAAQNFSLICNGEKVFQEKFGLTSEQLVARYSLTDEAKAEILNEFDKNQKRKNSEITVS